MIIKKNDLKNILTDRSSHYFLYFVAGSLIFRNGSLIQPQHITVLFDERFYFGIIQPQKELLDHATVLFQQIPQADHRKLRFRETKRLENFVRTLRCHILKIRMA